MTPTTKQSLAVVAVHGRDQTPHYMIDNLITPLDRDDVEWILPAAPTKQWYSGRAGEPLEHNQAELGPSLDLLRMCFAHRSPQQVLLIGFSQGACLVAELLATAWEPFAGAVLLTGTLLGPQPSSRTLNITLDGMPIVLGVGLRDPWMTTAAATNTQGVFDNAGADTKLHIVDSDEHRIFPEDIAATSNLIDQLLEETLRP